MMTQSPLSTIPVAPSQAELTFLPVLRNQHGDYFPELKRSDATKWQVILDIANAQHDRVQKVFAFDPVSGRCWDASKEVATGVLNEVLEERGEVPAWCIDFIEAHLGVATVNVAMQDLAA